MLLQFWVGGRVSKVLAMLFMLCSPWCSLKAQYESSLCLWALCEVN